MKKAESAVPVGAPVEKALILICEKCGSKLAVAGQDNPIHNLRQELKGRIKSHEGPKQMRALLSSCLDLCPENKMAFAVVPISKAIGGPRFYEITEKSTAENADEILEIATTITAGFT